jgi:hypothetical protein
MQVSPKHTAVTRRNDIDPFSSVGTEPEATVDRPPGVLLVVNGQDRARLYATYARVAASAVEAHADLRICRNRHLGRLSRSGAGKYAIDRTIR